MNKELELLREFYQEVCASSIDHSPRLNSLVKSIENFNNELVTVTRTLTYIGKGAEVSELLSQRNVVGSIKVPHHQVVISEVIQD